MVASATDGQKTYILAQTLTYANGAIALGLIHVSLDVQAVGNAVLGILIFLARAVAKKAGFLAKKDVDAGAN